MSDHTKIQWTDATWNPVTGCTQVSPGCDHCYALTLAERFRGTPGHYFEHGFDVQLRPAKLDQPLRWKRPRRIFVNSMSDLFHEKVPDEYIARVWQMMGAAPQHTYQVLTKRHSRMRSWVTRWYAGEVPEPERWAHVAGFPGYKINTRGLIIGKRADTANGMKVEAGQQGHLRVTLHREGSSRSGERRLVHRLVLEAFARPGRPGEQVRHLNGDAGDNRLSNLRWGTQEDNWADRLAHGNGRSYSKINEADAHAIRTRVAAGETAYAVAQDYPISDTQVRNIARGDQWKESYPQAYATGERAVLDCVWLGVSAEDQKWADIRIPALLDTPAAVRFVSAEPLLGPIDFESWLWDWWSEDRGGCTSEIMREPSGRLDWVIVGGESGRGARPMEPDWARSIRNQCQEAGVAFHFKQWGTANGHAKADRELDGRTWDEFPAHADAQSTHEI